MTGAHLRIHWGPDPGHGGLTQHIGRREDCSGPDCGPRADDFRCACTEHECYSDPSDYPVDSGDLCLHCHYLDSNLPCPAREAAELEDL